MEPISHTTVAAATVEEHDAGDGSVSDRELGVSRARNVLLSRAEEVEGAGVVDGGPWWRVVD
jgi:hypothetical protein